MSKFQAGNFGNKDSPLLVTKASNKSTANRSNDPSVYDNHLIFGKGQHCYTATSLVILITMYTTGGKTGMANVQVFFPSTL